MSTLSENVKGLMQRSHKDMLAMLSVADMANMQSRTQANMDRMNAQVDAQLKKCNPAYKPPEGDEVGNFTFINAGILADQQTASALVNAIRDGEKGGQAEGDAAPVAAAPVPVPQQQMPVYQPVPAPVPQSKTMIDRLKDSGKYLLPFLIGSGVSIAAAKYFAPDDTDTDTITEVDVVPWSPE